MIEIITHPIFLWCVGIFVVPGILMWIASYFVASYCIYNATLRRSKSEKWSRDIPDDINPEQKKMYEIGCEWSRQNFDKKQDVHIINDSLNLYGEYYDFGHNKCVMVLSGRTESLRYGYYFAIPYSKNGYNVLVVDPRAHGLSDGEFNTVGFEESKDIIAWVKYLENSCNIKSVVFHGICIGAAGGIFALTNAECPEIVSGIVTEGMFVNFGESMKNHLIESKRPVRFLYGLVDARMKHYTGHSMNYGPIDVIDKLDKPILMLQSLEDIYSTPENAKRLYEKAGSEQKKLVLFEHGRHSMLRITDTKKYDESIEAFLITLQEGEITNVL